MTSEGTGLKLRVCTYNCKNYFVSEASAFKKPDSERTALAQIVEQIDADIISLQEIENYSALEDINNRLRNPYPYLNLHKSNSKRGINLGTLSKQIFDGVSHRSYPLLAPDGSGLLEYRTTQDRLDNRLTPALFQRDLALSEFNIKGKSLLLFNTHLKSPNNYKWFINNANTLRLGEASLIRKIMSPYISNPDHYLILNGDLNQRYKHPSLIPICGWKELNDPVRKEVMKSSRKTTTFHSKPRQRIDYLLFSHSLLPHYQTGSATIHDSDIARTASDHLPVSIDFIF